MPIRGKRNPMPAKTKVAKGLFKTRGKDAQKGKAAQRACTEAMKNTNYKNGTS